MNRETTDNIIVYHMLETQKVDNTQDTQGAFVSLRQLYVTVMCYLEEWPDVIAKLSVQW